MAEIERRVPPAWDSPSSPIVSKSSVEGGGFGEGILVKREEVEGEGGGGVRSGREEATRVG